jgi:formylmethanofuran dehydrogenase subunit E
MVTGCSFGNNSLVYRDLGKTAVTITRRDGQAIRIALDPDFEDSRGQKYPEAYALFEKLIAKREPGEPEEFARMMHLFADMSMRELSVPVKTVFRLTKLNYRYPGICPYF